MERKKNKKGAGFLHSTRGVLLAHHHNNRKHPNLLACEFIVAIISLLVIAISFSVLHFGNLVDRITQSCAVLQAMVIGLTNEQRLLDNLSTLTPNTLLTEAAQNVAEDMASKGYFAHVSPEGKVPVQWLKQVKYKYQYVGENIAVNFEDSQQLVNAWMDSPTHKANILGNHFTEIGVGVATGTYQGQEAVFTVQFFASPSVVVGNTHVLR